MGKSATVPGKCYAISDGDRQDDPNLNLTMASKEKQPTEQNTDASVDINYADLTVEQIYQTIQKGLQQGQLLAKKLKSKKTSTNADKEFIKMAQNASQA